MPSSNSSPKHLFALAILFLLASAPFASGTLQYEYRTEHDPDGIGKFYLGREIAQVMGHPGASWLERPERAMEEKPDLLVEALKLKRGQVAADIGAGTGYFSWRLAQKVAPSGFVYAVDIQPEMLQLLTNNLASRGVTNVKPVLGTIQDAKLPPSSVDLILMVDVYHEFSHPFEMLESLCRGLKEGGRMVFVEYRAEDPSIPIKPVHKMTESQVKKETAAHPLVWLETIASLPRQHCMIFQKKTALDKK